jgi:two-component system response regulator YesN
MPEMNGLQMIAALNSQFPDLEVSVLTGYRDFEYAKEAIRLGVTRFLLKPSNMDELEEAIECMCANLNLAHFSRVFKKQVGVSANEYRNQVLGK